MGVVEKKKLIDGQSISPGDVLVGVASSGLHSNGFSLARKVVFEIAGLRAEDPAADLGCSVAEALLEPTRIYVRAVRRVLGYYKVKKVVHGIAHVTGGGLHENLARVLPEGIRATIDRGSWTVPGVFRWIERLGEVDPDEMDRVFNMGIGLVLVISPHYAESIRSQLADAGHESWTIGRVLAGKRGVAWS